MTQWAARDTLALESQPTCFFASSGETNIYISCCKSREQPPLEPQKLAVALDISEPLNQRWLLALEAYLPSE